MYRLLVVGVVALSSLVLATGSALAAPTVTVAPASAAPGGSVTVTGAGFDPNTRVDVFIDLTDVALGVSDGSGAVSATITIPKSTQPGTHWITLEELRTYAAAQAPLTVRVNWAQGGWGPSWREFNPLENTINTGNASQLTTAWAAPVTPYGNVKPFAVFNDDTYVFDESEGLHAYSSTGKVLWTATPGTTFRFSQATIVASGGLVYVGDSNGLVAAYKALCRTDGGLCAAPKWSVNIGTPVEGGLTIRNGFVYVPGGDGIVHVLNATTGAAATSITPFFSGATSQPVSFGADGAAFIVQGGAVSELRPDGSGGGISFAAGVVLSPVAVGNGIGYATSTDGKLDEVPGGWTETIGPTGCDIPPAFANGVVYAASCNSIGAYSAKTGLPIWTLSVSSQPSGLAVANGVLYACWGFRVSEYAASYGGELGSGDACNGPLAVVDGTVYSVEGQLFAATIDGAAVTRPSSRPDPKLLGPSG
jgi:hypothetical protein